MKTVSLSGSLRENVGKKDAKMLRNAGKVPCVLYGGAEQVHFTTEAANFKPILFTPETYLINIEIGKNTYQAILQDIQYHPVGDHVLHADFLLVRENKAVAVQLPVKTVGTSPGVIRGGKLKVKLTKVKVKGLVKQLPDFIELNISKLNIGQSIKVRDMKLDGVTFLDPASAVIVDVKAARGLTLAEEEEEAAATETEGEAKE